MPRPRQPMTVHLHQALIAPHRPIERLYFPVSGFTSITNDGARGSQIEIGMIGFEGLVGASVLLGSDRSPFDHFIQVPGEVLCIGTTDLCAAVD